MQQMISQHWRNRIFAFYTEWFGLTVNCYRKVGKNSGPENWGLRASGPSGKLCLIEFYILSILYAS